MLNTNKPSLAPLGLFCNPSSSRLFLLLYSVLLQKYRLKDYLPFSFTIPVLLSGATSQYASQAMRQSLPLMQGFIRRFITPD